MLDLSGFTHIFFQIYLVKGKQKKEQMQATILLLINHDTSCYGEQMNKGVNAYFLVLHALDRFVPLAESIHILSPLHDCTVHFCHSLDFDAILDIFLHANMITQWIHLSIMYNLAKRGIPS
ncbi:hypothetical protein ACJX0J_033034 [Zea mays]